MGTFVFVLKTLWKTRLGQEPYGVKEKQGPDEPCIVDEEVNVVVIGVAVAEKKEEKKKKKGTAPPSSYPPALRCTSSLPGFLACNNPVWYTP